MPGATKAASAGDPIRMTLRALRRLDAIATKTRGGARGRNPGVVAAAADALGTGCPPIVCAGGIPNGAVLLLLRALAEAGSTIAVHADFDWGGIRIANALVGGLGAGPWRMGTSDYERAPSGDALTGRPVAAAWDPALSSVTRCQGGVWRPMRSRSSRSFSPICDRGTGLRPETGGWGIIG